MRISNLYLVVLLSDYTPLLYHCRSFGTYELGSYKE